MGPTHQLLALMMHHKELQVNIPHYVVTIQPTAQDALKHMKQIEIHCINFYSTSRDQVFLVFPHNSAFNKQIPFILSETMNLSEFFLPITHFYCFFVQLQAQLLEQSA